MCLRSVDGRAALGQQETTSPHGKTHPTKTPAPHSPAIGHAKPHHPAGVTPAHARYPITRGAGTAREHTEGSHKTPHTKPGWCGSGHARTAARGCNRVLSGAYHQKQRRRLPREDAAPACLSDRSRRKNGHPHTRYLGTAACRRALPPIAGHRSLGGPLGCRRPRRRQQQHPRFCIVCQKDFSRSDYRGLKFSFAWAIPTAQSRRCGGVPPKSPALRPARTTHPRPARTSPG